MKLLVTVFVLVSAVLVCLTGCRSTGRQAETNANLANANSSTTSETSTETTAPPPELTKEQNEARVLLEQGKELFRQDRDTEAAETFKKALALDADFAEAHYRLGLTLASQGKRDEAEEEYKKA